MLYPSQRDHQPVPEGFPNHSQAAVAEAADGLARDVIRGLSRAVKAIPSKYFYDDAGSKLFQQIMAQPEYYLTKAESEIFNAHKAAIAAEIGSAPFNLIELGAGDGTKTAILIDEFLRLGLDFEYCPIDISSLALVTLADNLTKKYPTLRLNPVEGEYSQGLRTLHNKTARRSVVLFLGSSIGNMSPAETYPFLLQLHRHLTPGDLMLTGFDLRKDPNILQLAYNDPAGITTKFNLNLLHRINRELGADFDTEAFQHYACYNVISGAMESYLLSTKAQAVHLPTFDKCFTFTPWEPLHLEFSYKYTLPIIEDIATRTDFRVVAHYQCHPDHFVDSLWLAEPPRH